MAFDPVRVRAVMNNFGENVLDTARQNLRDRGSSVSGDLERKMKFVAKVMPNSMSLKFDLGEYGQGIDQGIEGSFQSKKVGLTGRTPFKFKALYPNRAMVDNVLSWAKAVGFNFYDAVERDGAYSLASYILREGISPNRFFTDAYEDYIREIPEDIAEAFGLDVDEFFRFIFKE
jgi:hypothetical protein